MPVLNWLGKDKVINHHQQVPYRVLEPQYAYGQTESGNMLIHGDNLDALKALLPRFEGGIKLIYIDPPYNTGNEGWVYNDNVNDPKIKKWLGEVVGREGEDLSRHDKWLCMMYPRLRLLQRLLADDGFIAVSIDENELVHLGFIMDEIFGRCNLLAYVPIRSEPSGGKGKGALRVGHEFMVIYRKSEQLQMRMESKEVTGVILTDEYGEYKKGRELSKCGSESLREDRPDMYFPLIAPDGTATYPIRNDGKAGRWRWGRKNPDMAAISENFQMAHWEMRAYDDGVVVDGKTERWFPYEKERKAKKEFGWSTWIEKGGFNSDGTAELKKIFGEKRFDTPKPTSLLEWVINLMQDKAGTVLDSFAGSGTTAHAVLNMNKRDGGARRFILVEMEDYAESITAERVRRVIDGYGATEGTGGGFAYCELGERLLLEDGNINENLGAEKIREYVWFTETRSKLVMIMQNAEIEPYLLGVQANTAYYFYYEKGHITVLGHDFLHGVKTQAGGYLIYADINALSVEEMDAMNIRFKKIPRDITRL
jgi:adenine-specific DNA-methyltransferase